MVIIVRSSNDIEGINIDKNLYKADDTTLFVSNINSICHAVKTLNDFEIHSGLKINIDKSEVIPLGTCRLKSITLPKSINKIKINHITLKKLHTWFSHDIKESISLNFNEKLRTILNIKKYLVS